MHSDKNTTRKTKLLPALLFFLQPYLSHLHAYKLIPPAGAHIYPSRSSKAYPEYTLCDAALHSGIVRLRSDR